MIATLIVGALVVGVLLLCTGVYLEHHDHPDGEQ